MAYWRARRSRRARSAADARCCYCHLGVCPVINVPNPSWNSGSERATARSPSAEEEARALRELLTLELEAAEVAGSLMSAESASTAHLVADQRLLEPAVHRGGEQPGAPYVAHDPHSHAGVGEPGVARPPAPSAPHGAQASRSLGALCPRPGRLRPRRDRSAAAVELLPSVRERVGPRAAIVVLSSPSTDPDAAHVGARPRRRPLPAEGAPPRRRGDARGSSAFGGTPRPLPEWSRRRRRNRPRRRSRRRRRSAAPRPRRRRRARRRSRRPPTPPPRVGRTARRGTPSPPRGPRGAGAREQILR